MSIDNKNKETKDAEQQSQLQREVSLVQKINEELQNSYFCVPPYDSVTHPWVSEVSHIIENKSDKKFLELCRTNGVTSDAKYKVTSLIMDPKRRAAQMVDRYKKLPIFSDFCEVIDHATVAFLEGDEICSRITLIPVIEGLFERWYNEINVKKFQKAKQENGSSIRSVLDQSIDGLIGTVNNDNPSPFIQIRVISCLKFLKAAIDEFYSNGKNGKSFNRNISLHSMIPVNYSDRLLDNCRLFLLIDIIAEAYFRIKKNYPNTLRIGGDVSEDLKKYVNFYLRCDHIKNGSNFNELKQSFWNENYQESK